MIKGKESSPGREMILTASLMTAPVQPARLWDYFSVTKDGTPRTRSNLIFTCQIWTIFYFTESEAISQNTCFKERLPDLSGIGQFHRTFQSGNRFVLLMGEVNENQSPQKRTSAVSWHFRLSRTEEFVVFIDRQAKKNHSTIEKGKCILSTHHMRIQTSRAKT